MVNEVCVKEIKRVINEKISKKNSFEIDLPISILTLEELNDIIKIIVDRGLFSKMTYEIIDNVYIKIKCS